MVWRSNCACAGKWILNSAMYNIASYECPSYKLYVFTLQTSPEAPLIFSLLHKLVRAENVEELKRTAIEKGGVSEEDVKVSRLYRGCTLFPNESCDRD